MSGPSDTSARTSNCVKFTTTPDDIIAARRLHAGTKSTRSTLLVYVGIVTFFAGLNVWQGQYYLADSRYRTWMILHIVGICCLIMLAMCGTAWLWGKAYMRFVFPNEVRRNYRQRAASGEERVVSWGSDGVLGETQRSHCRMKWMDYIKTRENKQVLLLYTSDADFEFLPKRAFSSEQLVSIRQYLGHTVRR